jgi:hypothetical protein
VEVQLHAFLTSALDRGEWSASRLGRFTARERALNTHWMGGWVVLRTGLDTVVNGTGTVVPVLPPTEHHAMKAYWGSGGTTPPII